MTGFKNLPLGAMLSAALLGNLAVAQTPTNISVVSGNGQLVCRYCAGSTIQVFEPLVVVVTDAGGNPVPIAPVNWTISSAASINLSLASLQTLTGTDGTSSNTVFDNFTRTLFVHTVVASLPNSTASVTFNLTEGAPTTSVLYAYSQVTSGLYQTLVGTAGGTASPPITVQIQSFNGQPLSNISVRLIPTPGYTPGASVACATGAGADPGSVLSDSTGLAICTPVFGPVPGNGSYHVLIGGVAAAQLNGTGPIGYQEFSSEFINVSPGAPGAVKIISGTPQSANPGQALTAPLVAEVDTAGGHAIAGAAVTWSVSPAGAAVLSSTVATSDATGQVSTQVTLANQASGVVQVTVAISNKISATFTVNANVPLTGISKSSGDGQGAPVNTAFVQPLVVKVSASPGQPVVNIPIAFSVTGPAKLNNATVNTDASGIAAVSVTAGSTTGPVTVTAAIGNLSVTFNLTVVPAAPVLTQSSFVNGAGFFATDKSHSALSPCGIGTVIAPGIATSVQGVVTGPMFGPLPYQLANVTISFNNSQAPLYNVANVNNQQQAAFQVPCDVAPSDTVPATVMVNGVAANVNVVVRSAGPGIFEYAMSDSARRAVLVKKDGSFVSLENPAHGGDVLRMFATGIGQVLPSVATNTLPVPGVDSLASGTVIVSVNNSGVNVLSARRAPELIGVDEITFQVPSGAPTGNDVALVLTVSAVDNPQSPQSSNTSKIPIQ